MNKLFEIPFSVEHLSNYEWKPDKVKPDFIEQDEYNKMIATYDEAQGKVMFKNTVVRYESCDCGGGYGCSHSDFPYMIEFKHDNTIDSCFEDEGLYIQNKNGFIKFDNEKNISMGHFIVACEMLGIKLEMTDYCLTMCDGFLTFLPESEIETEK